MRRRGSVVFRFGERFLLSGQHRGRIFLRSLIEFALRAAGFGHWSALDQLRRGRVHARVLYLLLAGLRVGVERNVASWNRIRSRRLCVHRRRRSRVWLSWKRLAPGRRRTSWWVVDRAVVALDLPGLALDRGVKLIAGIERFSLRLGFHQRVFVGWASVANDLADALTELDDFLTRCGLFAEQRHQIGLCLRLRFSVRLVYCLTRSADLSATCRQRGLRCRGAAGATLDAADSFHRRG
jgi:hypothetical protein